jgi:hypothetical protein
LERYPLGFYTDSEHAADIEKSIKGLGYGDSLKGRARWKIITTQLRNALKQANTDGMNGIVVASYNRGSSALRVREVIRHELFHRLQRELGVTPEIMAEFTQRPLALKARDGLLQNGYGDDYMTHWIEIGAHLAEGPAGWERMGLSRDEAKSLYRDYLEGWGKPEVADHKRIHHGLYGVLNDYRKTTAKQGREGEDSGELSAPVEGQQGGEVRGGVRPDVPGGGEAPGARPDPGKMSPSLGGRPTRNSMDSKAYWVDPSGKAIDISKVGTHSAFAKKHLGSSGQTTGLDAIGKMTSQGWVRIRGNGVEVNSESIGTAGFEKAVMLAAGHAKENGFQTISVDITKPGKPESRDFDSLSVPLDEIGEFLSNPRKYIRAKGRSGPRLGASAVPPPEIREQAMVNA